MCAAGVEEIEKSRFVSFELMEAAFFSCLVKSACGMLAENLPISN